MKVMDDDIYVEFVCVYCIPSFLIRGMEYLLGMFFFFFCVCGGGEKFKKIFGQHVFGGTFNRYFNHAPQKQEMKTGGEKTSGYPPSNRPNP